MVRNINPKLELALAWLTYFETLDFPDPSSIPGLDIWINLSIIEKKKFLRHLLEFTIFSFFLVKPVVLIFTNHKNSCFWKLILINDNDTQIIFYYKISEKNFPFHYNLLELLKNPCNCFHLIKVLIIIEQY